MANRPCKPDADTQRLWRMLMPGTPMPACGIGEQETAGEQPPQDEQNDKPDGDKRR